MLKIADYGKPLHEYEVGEWYSYIDDRLFFKPGTRHERVMVHEDIAMAMLAQVLGDERFEYSSWGNKDYLCVAADENGHRMFVYKHDFTWWVYIVVHET